VAAFFELRQYKLKPGQSEAWVKYMEELVIPFQTEKGMVIVGSFLVENDPETYIWIRRFDSEEERVKLYDAVYQSDRWKNEIGPPIGDLIDRSQIVVTRIVATPRSVIR
jgi:hypothetical protein